LIGVGWGELVHAPAFRAVDGYDLVALCSRNASRVSAAGERLGITDTSTDWRDFVERDDLDLIVVASPVELHHDMTIAALRAGKHVLCEKPLAISAEQAAAMVRAADESGKATAACFELRWSADRLPVWDLVRGGYLGQPYFSRLVQSAAYWHPSHKPQSAWMYDLSQGGGYLNGLVVHDIDFVCTMLGEPVAVSAEVRTTIPRRAMADGTVVDVTADDTAVLILRLDSGVVAELSASVVGAHTAGWRLEAFGSDGTIVASGGRGPGAQLQVAQAADDGLAPFDGEPREPLSRPDLPNRGSSAMVRAMALMLEDWLPAFSGQPSVAPSFRDGWRAASVIEAARASAAGAGWVDIPSRPS